ncbi:sigma-54-dependent transcriptional regulator [Anaeromicrobium sediminis]|uniref:sigma-54-dependent transcriptional regulator n=1 Tax=Anaeromicrobium sediminis TaxID=1478221 RepID=UPI001A9A2D42|nr:sigma-54 dependent transcriptional regulator [Anaeromicrobium sediminis]
MEQILIVDDEAAICASLECALEEEYEVFIANKPSEVYECLRNNNIKIMILDLKLGKYNGLDILQEVKKYHIGIEVIVITAFSSIDTTIKAIKGGAYYYVSKPVNIKDLKSLINNALKHQQLNNEIVHLNEEIEKGHKLGDIIGKSESIKEVFQLINKVKDIDCNVLITGESGTGKELVARAIHYLGNKRNEHLEVVNCAAIPSDLLESELFGYAKGAFTGAVHDKAGKFEIANKGTIFLDEIGEMDIQLQSKLLRVLQEKKVTQLGSNKERKIHVRIVAATNRILEEEILKKNFREDLFYRLNVIQIKMPSLRERKEDIPLLIGHFIRKYSKEYNKTIKEIDRNVLKFLECYDYKGNIRELANIVERLIILCDDSKISYKDIPIDMRQSSSKDNFHSDKIAIQIGESLKEAEKKIIENTLKGNHGNKRLTAAVLGISERTLYYKIKEYKIKV